MRATTRHGRMRRCLTSGLAALASLALLATLAAAPASALKRYRTPGYKGRTHLPKHAYQPALPGSKPISLSSAGRFPDDVVDDAGTAHIVWSEDDGDNADVVRYCRLRRAAKSCDNPAASQRLVWVKSYGPGDGPQFNGDQDGPRILQLGDSLVILDFRYPTTAPKPDGSNVSATVLAWVSDDGGESFSGPAIIGIAEINGGALVYGPDDDPTILTITQTNFCGTCIQAFRPGQFSSAQLKLGAGHKDSAYYGSLALDGSTPVAAFADLNRTTFLRRLTNGGAPLAGGSWTPAVTVGGDEPKLAGGPAGAFLLNRPTFGGPFVVRKVAGGAIGKAVTVSDKAGAGLADFFEDPSGRLLAGWVTDVGRSPGVRLRTSQGGRSWTPAQALLRGANAGQLAIGATSDGGGVVALNTTGGINSFGPIAAVPIGPRTPTGKVGLGNRAGGGDPNAKAGCQQITFGVVKITTQAGCFWRGRGKDAGISYTTGELDFNGLKIVPDPGARVLVDARHHALDTIGAVRALVRSSLTGDVVLWHGPLTVKLPTAASGVPFSFPTGPFHPELKGFPIVGRIDVYLTNHGVRIPISLKLPPYLGGVSGQAELIADSATGLHLDSIVIDVPDAPLGPVVLRGVHIEYHGEGERWEGRGALLLPPQPGGARLDMDVAFEHGDFASGHLKVTPPFPPGIAVGPGVFLSQIGGGVDDLSPLAVSLDGQFGALPLSPKGPFTATVDGRGTIRFGDPLTFTFDGTGSLLDIALSHEHFEVNANGYATLRAGTQFDLGIVSGRGEGEATIDAPGRQFLADLHGNVSLAGQSFVDAEALASNIGFAGCYKLTLVALGFGYRWGDTLPDIMFPSCDLSAYKPTPGGAPPAGQVVSGSSFTVKGGTPTVSLRVDGQGGVPVVELLAPGEAIPIAPVLAARRRFRGHARDLGPDRPAADHDRHPASRGGHLEGAAAGERRERVRTPSRRTARPRRRRDGHPARDRPHAADRFRPRARARALAPARLPRHQAGGVDGHVPRARPRRNADPGQAAQGRPRDAALHHRRPARRQAHDRRAARAGRRPAPAPHGRLLPRAEAAAARAGAARGDPPPPRGRCDPLVPFPQRRRLPRARHDLRRPQARLRPRRPQTLPAHPPRRRPLPRHRHGLRPDSLRPLRPRAPRAALSGRPRSAEASCPAVVLRPRSRTLRRAGTRAKLRGVTPSRRRAASSRRRAAVRRRRAALAAAALVALAVGVAIRGGGGAGDGAPAGATVAASSGRGAPAGDAEPAASALERARGDVARMPLARQVGELLVISFAGASAPQYVLDALREGRAAGVILFGGNAPSAASVRALTRSLQRAATGRSEGRGTGASAATGAAARPPAIVCLDQEGGAIRTLRFAPSAVGQAGQPAPRAAGSAATATARALRRAGVNVVLGPVADVAAGTRGSVMADRAYPGGAAAVAASVRAAVHAYARAGIAATPKHFPGLGGARVNTDREPARVGRTRVQIEAGDLAPFRAAIAAGAPLVMLAHARYPALDPHRIASQSHAIATGLLRGELGFGGVAMTDSLEARAALEATGSRPPDVGAAAVRSLQAGADLLLSTGPGSFPLIRDAVIARARRSAAFRARVADAAARVLALRRGLGTG